MITREEWLMYLVENLDKYLFEGDLHLEEHKYQIGVGRVRGKKGVEVVQPSDGEMIDLNDFFPTTIAIDWETQTVEQMAINLAWACIPAFMNIQPKGKIFAKRMKQYYFDKPYKEAHPSQYCLDLIKMSILQTIQEHGEFPGKPVKFPVKEKKEAKKNSYTIFCGECGMEYKVSKKMLDKHGWKTPTCPYCGCGMGIDNEGENNEDIEENAFKNEVGELIKEANKI